LKESPVSDFAVTIADGPSRDERTVTVGTTLADLFAGDRSVVAARLTDPVGTRLVDLATLAKAGDVVEPVAADSEDGRAIIRHSTAHVLAQAVRRRAVQAGADRAQGQGVLRRRRRGRGRRGRRR
jgi:threonyl-tRNA synthetase